MQTVRRTGVLAAGLVAVLAFAGCGAAVDDADEAAPAERDVPQDEAAAGAAAEEGDGADGDGPPSDEAPGGEAGGSLIDVRSIIYTGQITIRVDEVDAAAAEATALAERHGGFVGGDRRSISEHGSHATLVLRIPSANFTGAVNELAGLGEEETREIDTDDVTEEVVDLQTRIATAEASVERTRDLLDRADSISDIVAVEDELAERESRLASLQARQRELAGLTALSTITASLVGPDAPAEEDEEETEPPELGFLPGLGAGWGAFTRTMTVVATVFGALLPWLVAASVPAAAAVWWARRHRPGAPPPLEQGAPPQA